MKRLHMLLVPLFAIPFLAGCKMEAYALIFDMEHCSMVDEQGDTHTGLYTLLTSKEKTVTGKLVPDEGFTFSDGTVQFVNNDTKEEITEGCSFDVTSGNFSVKITTDIRVLATPQKV